MVFATSAIGVAAAALWSASVSASPLEQLAQKKTFSLNQVAVERTEPWLAPVQVRKAYYKYGAPVPADIDTAADLQIEALANITAGIDLAPGTGSVPVRPVKGDVEYLVNVTVGNHQLALDLDTGSSDLWVFSTLQPSDQKEGRPVQRVYDPSGSSAVQLNGHSWQIRYGDMSGANGKVYLDTVSIGGVSVQKQAVEAAATVSKAFTKDLANDGIVGLAFSKLNTVKPQPQRTWFENARKNLAAPVFTCNLKKRAAGQYDFGFIDKAKYKGDLTYVDVNANKGFWVFEPSGFAIGDGPTQDLKINAIADTGTSLWYMPKASTEAYWEQVPGAVYNNMQGGYTYPCGAKLPDFHVVVGGRKISVSGANMNYQQMSSNTCFGGVQRDTGMPFSIFGDVFLKSVFTVFEMPEGRTPRIGFAQQA